MNYNKGERIYIKYSRGVDSIEGLSGVIVSVRKKDREIVSIRCAINKIISIADGVRDYNYLSTFRLDNKCFEFFSSIESFKTSMKLGLCNLGVVVQKTSEELSNFK